MGHLLLRSAVLTASVAVVLPASAAVTSMASTATATAETATVQAAAHHAGRAVFLVTGEPVTTSGSRVSVAGGSRGQKLGSGGQLQVLRLGGKTYVMPITAAPYLGRGLDPGLFQTSALAAAESGGRLPVRVGYSGRVPALPGVRITSSGAGTAEGYLTAPGARAFGAALARQFAADHAGDSYGQDGLFGSGVTITLAGAPAAARPRPGHARPDFPMHTLTVRGTNFSGGPDTGDPVSIIDADKANLFWTPGQDESAFYHGAAKFSVPSGHFWVIGVFFQLKGTQVGTHLVVLPEITVDRATTVRVAARAADSQVQFVTSRPSSVYSSVFTMQFLTYKAPHGCCSVSSSFIDIPGQGDPPLYVSPMPAPPGTGTLTQITAAQLDSPSTAPGVPYQYDVAYQSQGIIPPQRFVVNQARVATENARFYAAAPSKGYLASFGAFADQLGSLAVLPRTRFPERLTMYLTAGPSLTWRTVYIQWGRGLDFVGGQYGSPQTFLPGQRLTDDWGAYPLHPATSVRSLALNRTGPVQVSASRAGDTLGLAMTAFGDNTPGHQGEGIYAPFKAAGSYEIDQNGTKIAGGPLPRFHGFARVTAHLSPARSLIRFVLNAAQPATLSPLSVSSQTAWSWWSAHEAGATLPPGWVCTARFNRSCKAQPLLTLRYGVLGEGVDGAASPGQQVVRVWAGHMQPAKATKITSVAMSVSFDGGKTWHPAQMTGSGGSYAAVFNAPAGAMVTLRTRATDAIGGSVTQTIASAYRTVSASGAPS